MSKKTSLGKSDPTQSAGQGSFSLPGQAQIGSGSDPPQAKPKRSGKAGKGKMVSRGIDPREVKDAPLQASLWTKEYADLVYFSPEVKACQPPFVGVCAMKALRWAQEHRTSLSCITSATFSETCECDLCRYRASRPGKGYVPSGTPIPHGQQWMVERLPEVVEEVPVPDHVCAITEVDCNVDAGEKMPKAAKRKKRKKMLETLWSQFP